MFKHEKQMLHEIKVDGPNPNYGALLQEQLGGPQGELKAAMQYLSQSCLLYTSRKGICPAASAVPMLPTR